MLVSSHSVSGKKYICSLEIKLILRGYPYSASDFQLHGNGGTSSRQQSSKMRNYMYHCKSPVGQTLSFLCVTVPSVSSRTSIKYVYLIGHFHVTLLCHFYAKKKEVKQRQGIKKKLTRRKVTDTNEERRKDDGHLECMNNLITNSTIFISPQYGTSFHTRLQSHQKNRSRDQPLKMIMRFRVPRHLIS